MRKESLTQYQKRNGIKAQVIPRKRALISQARDIFLMLEQYKGIVEDWMDYESAECHTIPALNQDQRLALKHTLDMLEYAVRNLKPSFDTFYNHIERPG